MGPCGAATGHRGSFGHETRSIAAPGRDGHCGIWSRGRVRPGEKTARRVGAPRCAPSIFPPNSAPRGPGLAIAPKLRPRRRTRPAYTDARRAAVGGNERAVDLTQSEVLLTMCITYFHPHSCPRAHPCARGAANPPTNIWQKPEWALSPDEFFGFDRPEGATRASGQKAGKGRAPARLKPRA